MKQKNNPTDSSRSNDLPNLNIIDLDNETPSSEHATEAPEDSANTPETDVDDEKTGILGFLSRINIHIVLLVMFVIVVIAVCYRFNNWGQFIDLDEIFKDGKGSYSDTFDSIIPLIDSEGDPVFKEYGAGDDILLFGNAPFADDRDSADNLANMIQEMTGANVYNCSVSGSYLAAQWPYLSVDDCPMDIFNFYWLMTVMVGDSIDYSYRFGVESMGDAAPPEAMEVYNTLQTIDLNEVDVIAIMYDASDYLAGHEMYSDENNTDILQFTGNMEAGIELIHDNYPNIRFMVLSPTYAYGLDEDGNYISSDIQRYGQDVLSTYVIKQSDSCATQNVTFIDNLYGTITEANADQYLTDHLHLNVEGRKLVAERFVEALNYYAESANK